MCKIIYLLNIVNIPIKIIISNEKMLFLYWFITVSFLKYSIVRWDKDFEMINCTRLGSGILLSHSSVSANGFMGKDIMGVTLA